MIKVYKSPTVPKSLSATKAYNGEDVKNQLLLDHKGKCYLCERSRDTDWEIEHFKSQKNAPELIREWGNLLLTCSYCNGKKLNHYDNILNPVFIEIENEIHQKINHAEKRAEFIPINGESTEKKDTIALLNRLYNGKRGIREINEERFFEKCLSVMNAFSGMVVRFLLHPSTDVERAIEESLGVDKEMLAFKYWVIRSNKTLEDRFSERLVWNK